MRNVIVIAFLTAVVAGMALAAAPTNKEDRVIAQGVKDLAKMHRVTEKPFIMDPLAATRCEASTRFTGPHDTRAWCHVFVNEAGAETMKTGKGSYAVGTLIIKQKFLDEAGKQPSVYTVMRKMEAGYDAEHGDWEYSIVDRAGTVISRGKTDSCIECHAAYKETDYVTRLYLKAETAPPKVSTNTDNPPAK